MIDWLIELDHGITLALNAAHTPFLDSIMLILSAKKVWIPLYAVLAVLMFIPKWYGRKSPAFRYGSRIPLWLTGLAGVLAVLLCFGLTEQVTNLVKDWVARPGLVTILCFRDCSTSPKVRAAVTVFLGPCLQHLWYGRCHGPDLQARVVFCRNNHMGSTDQLQPNLPCQTFYHRCHLRSTDRSSCSHSGLPALPVDTDPDIKKYS